MQKNIDAKEEAEPAGPEEKEEEDPQVKMRQRATKNVKASLIIDAIGQKEGVTVSDAEVDEKISSLAKRFSATPESLRNFYQYRDGLENLRHSIYEDKVLDILLSKAVVEKENE
jgi:trigger factor